jgi:hypothetical protein
MAGSENVFNIIQFGPQSGTAYAPGTAVPATKLIPIEAPVQFLLDRASSYPKQDRGRNVRNSAGTGYHGVRGADATIPGQLHFEDIIDFLEMHYAGGIVPTGVGPYTWIYPFEAVTPTLIPRTIEGGNTDAAQAQQRLDSCLVDSLTLGFPDIVAPGAYPWTLSAAIYALDREISALTGSLSPRAGLETVQGHLSRLYEGTTATVFASLAELTGSLKSFTMTTNRNLARRAYGSASDVATRFGFKDLSTGTVEAKIGISATSKTDFHDIWNVASPASLGERRWRIQAAGTGTKMFTIDMRVGITAVPYDDVDGERVFKVTGEIVDDSTLSAPAQITVVNSIASL